MNQRLATMATMVAAIICAIIVGALIGGVARPRQQDVQGVSDESRPVITAGPASTAESAPVPVIETLAPDATNVPATPTIATPRESSPSPEPPTATPGTESPPVISYTIQSGDILNSLAQQFNTTTQAIIELNPGINPDSLRIGEVLQIPAQEP